MFSLMRPMKPSLVIPTWFGCLIALICFSFGSTKSTTSFPLSEAIAVRSLFKNCPAPSEPKEFEKRLRNALGTLRSSMKSLKAPGVIGIEVPSTDRVAWSTSSIELRETCFLNGWFWAASFAFSSKTPCEMVVICAMFFEILLICKFNTILRNEKTFSKLFSILRIEISIIFSELRKFQDKGDLGPLSPERLPHHEGLSYVFEINMINLLLHNKPYSFIVNL